VNELSGEHIPLLEKEGCMRGQKNIAKPPWSAQTQTGEMIRPERFRRTEHPVCGNSVASRYLIDAAATPPFQGRECRLIPIDSHVHSRMSIESKEQSRL
jgi:hypothetical protein